MRKYEVTPYIGLGPVILGMTREEVSAVMFGKPKTFMRDPDAEYETDAYDHSGIHIYYSGEEPSVVYIEAFPCDNVNFVYNGKSVFDTTVEALLQHIELDAPFTVKEPRCHYLFPALDLTLWRSHAPSPEEDKDSVFESLGIGDLGFFRRG